MESGSITISIDSCDIDDYVIAGAGIGPASEGIQSVAITWNDAGHGNARTPLPSRVHIDALSSVLTDLSTGGSTATLVVSKHDFDALRAALAVSPRQLTIDDGGPTFFCKTATRRTAFALSASVGRIADAATLTLGEVRDLEQQVIRVNARLDKLLQDGLPKPLSLGDNNGAARDAGKSSIESAGKIG